MGTLPPAEFGGHWGRGGGFSTVGKPEGGRFAANLAARTEQRTPEELLPRCGLRQAAALPRQHELHHAADDNFSRSSILSSSPRISPGWVG